MYFELFVEHILSTKVENDFVCLDVDYNDLFEQELNFDPTVRLVDDFSYDDCKVLRGIFAVLCKDTPVVQLKNFPFWHWLWERLSFFSVDCGFYL